MVAAQGVPKCSGLNAKSDCQDHAKSLPKEFHTVFPKLKDDIKKNQGDFALDLLQVFKAINGTRYSTEPAF